MVQDQGIWSTVSSSFVAPDSTTWRILAAFLILELLLLRFVPGRTYQGPISPSGHVPTYRENGLRCFFLSVLVYLAATTSGLVSSTLVYEQYPQLMSALVITALGVCLLLYLKGLLMPSGADSGSTGNVVFDYYWGTELYPRIAGFDVKQVTNCRFGMMAWSLLPIAFAQHAIDVNGHLPFAMAVNVALQLVYCAKFFHWERGYMTSMDICHDRAGYYIVWGCLCWVPSTYIVSSYWLCHQSTDITPVMAGVITALGLAMIYINYACDAQRQLARATDGECTIWGRKAEFLRAQYVTEKGDLKQSLLLTSGYWGLARHFHYVPEILAAVLWTLPSGFSSPLPWFYVAFLTILLVDRAYRDDARCRAKYAAYWDQYCTLVPWRIIPGVL